MRFAPDRAVVSSSPRRSLALGIALGIALAALSLPIAGCCFGGPTLGAPPPPPPVPYPPTPPIGTPPIGAPTGPLTLDCMGLCQRTGACMDASGTPRGADEANCTASCAPGGAYANMPPDSYRCVAMPTCDQFDQCTGQAIAAMLAQILGGGAPPPPPAVVGAPPGWPAGFPIVPGGTPVPAPAAGPVTVALLAYPGTTPDALEAQYRAELATSGWSATPAMVSPGQAHRFQASRPGSSISISIYTDGAQTFIQTMQF